MKDIKAGDWETLWDVLGDDRPCKAWREWLAHYETVSDALDGIRRRDVHPGSDPYDEHPLLSRGWEYGDLLEARAWAWSLIMGHEEFIVPKRMPSKRRILDALRERVRSS